MQRTQHPSNNAVIGAPKGMSIEECNALPVTIAKFDNGEPVIYSWWTPSAQELVLLNCGHAVRLAVLGNKQPPVAIDVDDFYQKLPT